MLKLKTALPIIFAILNAASKPLPYTYNLTELFQSIKCDQTVPDLTQSFNEDAILERTKSCQTYFEHIPFKHFSHEETRHDSGFPLAFTHTILDRVNLLESFLIAHFRRTDVHCIHVAQNAPDNVFRAVKRLLTCYQLKYPSTLIFLTPRRIPVLMRHASYLDSHVLCLNMLLNLSYEWKMWVHISPGDFPIRSIDELRRNLKFNNKTIIDVRINEHQNRQGRVYGYDIISHSTHQIQKSVISNYPIEPPCNLVIAEGDPCVALLKDDVKALLGTTIPLHLFHWFRHSDVPEQHFFATLATITAIQKQSTGQFLVPIVYDFDQIITPNMMSSEHECVRSFEWYQGIRIKRSENGIPEENHFHLLRLCHKSNDTCQQPHMLLETLKLTEPPKKLPFEDTAICMRKQVISRSACENAEFKRSCHVQLTHLRELKDSQCFFGNYFDSQNEGSRALACQLKSLLKQGMVLAQISE